MDQKADLHCHSLHSDGTCSPTELVDLAIQMNFCGLSITDHDSLEAFDEAYPYSTQKGIVFLPGVEISAKFRNEPIHVLGYSFDPHSKSLFEFCRLHRERREIRNQLMLEKLAHAGMTVAIEEVKSLSPHATTYGRPHIALAMMQHGYVEDVASAFRRYLGAGKSCYVEGEKWTVEEAIAAIHAAKGKAVLAHPQLIKARYVIEDLLALPFDGLEAYYNSMNADVNRRWCEKAQQHALFVTGGSDFHGTVKPEIHFGSSWAPEETFHLLNHHFLSL
jgi:predicted metal-dependent phosphoesterase TrpH